MSSNSLTFETNPQAASDVTKVQHLFYSGMRKRKRSLGSTASAFVGGYVTSEITSF